MIISNFLMEYLFIAQGVAQPEFRILARKA